MTDTDFGLSTLHHDGIVPLDAAAGELAIDRVHARAYAHPALGSRPVIRLGQSLQAAGTDAEMAALGFGAGQAGPALGVQRRRALGFPAWALVHDPARSRYALQTLQRFKKAAARIATKPGHARDEFAQIADELSQAVPHFLPSFWEEAARAFLDHGAVQMAASSFEKARQAELHFALAVDENARAESFLEFALQGALAVKSLVAYAKDLERLHGAAAAYQRFSALCVRRCKGGSPPWATMFADLRRLAKAAKLPDDAAEHPLIKQLLPTAGMRRAAAEVWQALSKTLAKLALADAAIRRQLLAAWPEPIEGDDEFAAFWLQLLADAGALAVFADSDAAAGSLGPAAWISRLLQAGLEPPEALHAALPHWVARIKADGAPVQFENADDWQHDYPVDFLEFMLQLGVPVADPSDDAEINLATWAGYDGKDPQRPRNPAAIAADSRFAQLLAEAAGHASDDDDFARVAPGKPALTAARAAFLRQLVAQAGEGYLPQVGEAVSSLQDNLKPSYLQEFPDLLASLQAIDLGAALGRQLRFGLFDEWAWPAFERALADLGGGKDDCELGGAFPFLVVYNARKARVLGPQEVVAEHDFVVPPKCSVKRVLYCQGQLLVVFRDKNYADKAYWSGDPKRVFDAENLWSLPAGNAAAAVDANGGMNFGGRTLLGGDTGWGDVRRVFGDGRRFWIDNDDADGDDDDDDDDRIKPHLGPALRELDPATGKAGRPAWPEFLGALADEHHRVLTSESSLLPAPQGLASSPLGMAGGLLGAGVRVRVGKGQDWVQVQRIDGQTWQGDLDCNPCGLMRAPAGPHWWIVDRNGSTASLYSADNALAANLDDNPSERGAWPQVPPLVFWHYLHPRDERASACLRQLPDATAAAWLGLAMQQLAAGATEDKFDLQPLQQRIGADLPAGADPTLCQGVAAETLRWALLQQKIGQLHQKVAAQAEHPAAEALLPAGDDDKAIEAFGKLCGDERYVSGELTRHWAAVAAFLQGPSDQPRKAIDGSDIAWWRWLGAGKALGWRLLGVQQSEDERTQGKEIIEAWLQTPFCALPWAVRGLEGNLKERDSAFALPDEDDEDSLAGAWTVARGGSYYVVQCDGYWDEDDGCDVKVLEFHRDETFATPPELTVAETEKLAVADHRQWLADLLGLLAEKGPPAWNPALAAQIADETGLSPAAATLWWHGLPNCHGYAHDFLGKPLREALGLKTAEAARAKEALGSVKSAELLAVLAAACPDDPARLWTPDDGQGGALQQFCAAYQAQFGKQVAIDEALLGDVSKNLPDLDDAVATLRALLDPDGTPWLHADVDWGLDSCGDCVAPDGHGQFDGAALVGLVQAALHACQSLPAGHAALQQLPRMVQVLRARLQHRGLLLGIGRWDADDAKGKKSLKALLKTLAGAPLAITGDNEDGAKAFDGGRILWVVSDEDVDFAFRPALLDGSDELLSKIAAACYGGADGVLAAVAAVQSGALERAVAEKAGLAAGGFGQNPLLTAPALVAATQQACGLSPDAAALYLQLLALHEPTAKNLQLFNGWTAAQLKRAAEDLAARKLVLAAKRPRAGRDWFLPGGWTALAAPDLPLETWKLPLYGIEDSAAPLGRVLPLQPFAAIFAQAWARVQAGDGPKYAEVGR